MRFLANENFPLSSVFLLRSSGHDVSAIIQDSPGATDEEILSRAVDEQRIILTFDRDYGELIYHLRKPSPPGLVYFRFEPATPTEPAEYLLQLLAQQDISLKKFTVAERSVIRQRPLP